MEMGNKIAYMRVVHGGLRLGLPGPQRRRIVGKKADDVDLRQVAKFPAAQTREFAAKDEVEKLFALLRHELRTPCFWPPNCVSLI
jgi:hypothetical protein